MTNHIRMLGTARQPFCGKCCGERTKRGSARQKRAQRRSDRHLLKTRGEEAF